MMQRSEPGAQKTDFRLVQSYIPFAEMITRAVLFTALALQIRGLVSGHVFLTLTFLIVYVDLLCHASTHSSAVGMHLVPVAFMLTTADRESVLPVPYKMHLALDALWACVCVAHYACSMMRVHSPYLWPRIALIAVSVLLHMPSTAYDMTQGEVYVRVFLFYTFCFVHYHVFSARVPYDNHTHTLLGPNVNLYILFVHPHVVLLALVGTCCVVCTMHFEDCRLHKREDCASAPAPKEAAPAPTPDREMQELMLELRAAQGSRV
jgi:hypothetical protein